MGFWNLRRKKEKAEEEKLEKEKVESTEEKKSPEEEQIEQLVEKTISYVMSPEYKSESSFTEFDFKRGKCILTSRSDYMPLFKKGLKQYTIGWKSAINELPSETELIEATTKAICNLYSIDSINSQILRSVRTNIHNLLELNAEGKYNDGIYKNIFSDPVKDANTMKKIEKKINEEKLLNERIEKLKSIVNKPIKYGDSGNSNEEVNFDEEFNNFAETLREQKMDEVVIFKLVTRMGELRKQYESVIRHPGKNLVQRLEAQVLLEYYEQIKKQKEAEEEARNKAFMEEYESMMRDSSGLGVSDLSNSINEIKEDVSTLTWLKIIDGIFGP